ncbi:MAG: hypothetical protein FWG40_00760 [Peptococcaceae bacterium]|nr:hypothetical protein [Peptococcaceae bacterium]
MCKRCEIRYTGTGEILFDGDGMIAIREDDKLAVNIHGEQATVPINYCFECGRKLCGKERSGE